MRYSVWILATAFALASISILEATAADPVINSKKLQFSFKGTSTVVSTRTPAEGKTDFVWGSMESFDDHFHTINWNVHQPDPTEDRFVVAFIEKVDVDGGYIAVQIEWSVETSSVDSIAAAMQLAKEIPANRNKNAFFYRSDNRVRQWRKQMEPFFFLGYVKGRDLSELELDREGIGTFTESLAKYSFHVDRTSGFVTSLEVETKPDPPSIGKKSDNNPFGASPFARPPRSLGSNQLSEFQLRGENSATWKHESESRVSGAAGTISFDVRKEVVGLSNQVVWPFTLEQPPENGDPITLMESQQIAAEWRDGKIVRVFHEGTAEELASATFRTPKNRSVLRYMSVGALLIVGFFLIRFFSSRSTK